MSAATECPSVRTWLYVPCEEREAVKGLGAHWDVEAKCWYIDSALDPTPFRRWLEAVPPANPYTITSDQAFILSARARCWKCGASIRVACLYCQSGCIDGEPYEEFTVSNITAVDEVLRGQLGAFRDFRFGYCRVAGGRHLINHCSRCGAVQADYYLHCEPSGAFFRFRNARAGAFEITPLAGQVRLTGDEGFEP